MTCATGPTSKPTIPRYADDRFFYKVEKWTKDGSKVDRLLYAGNNLDKAHAYCFRPPSSIGPASD